MKIIPYHAGFLTGKFRRALLGLILQLPILIFLFSSILLSENTTLLISYFMLIGFIGFLTLINLYVQLYEPKLSFFVKYFLFFPFHFFQMTSFLSALPLSILLIFIIFNGITLSTIMLGLKIIVFCLIAASYFILIRSNWVKINKIDLNKLIKNTAQKEYKITHISDLHIGNLTSIKKLKKFIKKINALNNNLIVITGDIITVGDVFIGKIAHTLGQLKAPDGVFIALGNHDYFCTDTKILIKQLESFNLKVLHNMNFKLQTDNFDLLIVGIAGIVNNIEKQKEALKSALQNIELTSKNQINILLAHDPTIFNHQECDDFHITLSGHTHGGQFAIPFFYRKYNLAKRYYPFNSGLYSHKSRYLYVNSGFGVDHLPARIGVPPEIAIITLKS